MDPQQNQLDMSTFQPVATPPANSGLDLSTFKPVAGSTVPSSSALPTPVEAGNLDPYNRPILHNSDGTVSTTRSFSIGTDKGEVLIPRIFDGQDHTEQEAIAHYKQTGQHLGIFRNAAEADAYATWLHNEQAKRVPRGDPDRFNMGKGLSDMLHNAGRWLALHSIQPESEKGSLLEPAAELGGGVMRGAAMTAHGLGDITYPGWARKRDGAPADAETKISAGNLDSESDPAKMGSLVENLLEWFSGEEAIAGGKAAAAKVLSTGDKLVEAGRLAKILERYPKIAKLVGVAARQAEPAAISGAQTFVKTGGDPGAAATAAAETAGLGAAVEGAAGGAAHLLREHSATTENVGGVDVTVPASARRTKMTPQQQQGQDVIRKGAQDVAARNLQEVNESRAGEQYPDQITDPSRRLPGEVPKRGPFEFKLRGLPTTETTSGSGVVPAAEANRARVITGLPAAPLPGSQSARNVRELGSTAESVPPRLMRDQPYLTSPAAGSETESVAIEGGGTLRTQDPNVVRQHIANLNDIISHEEFGSLSPQQQSELLQARNESRQQMADYHRATDPRAGRPNFYQIDIPREVSKIGSYSEAAHAVESTATEGYNSIADALALNDISGGKFTAIRNANRAAWNAYTGATSAEGLHAAERAIDDTNQQMQDLLKNDIGGAVNQKELSGFNDAYRAAQMLKKVGAAVDGAFSGNASASARSWEYRGFDGQGLMSRLDRLIAKEGRPAVERYIGRDNLNNLYAVADLNRTNVARSKFGAVMQPVADWLEQHPQTIARLGGLVVGGEIGREMGIGWGYGALAGAGGALLTRQLMNMVLSNPRVAQQMIYAVEKGANPKVYAPLIGTMIQRITTEQSQLERSLHEQGGEDNAQ
jgi:hypothetical protein